MARGFECSGGPMDGEFVTLHEGNALVLYARHPFPTKAEPFLTGRYELRHWGWGVRLEWQGWK